VTQKLSKSKEALAEVKTKLAKAERQLESRTEETGRKTLLVETLQKAVDEGDVANTELRKEVETLRGELKLQAEGTAEKDAQLRAEADAERQKCVSSLEEQIVKLKQENAKLENAMIEMSQAHTEEIVAFMQSAQASAAGRRPGVY